ERREWARSRALRALAALRDDAYRRREPAQVMEWCRRILRIDPYQEATYRALMLTHGRLGELGLVRGWHELCVRRLRDDLALEPVFEAPDERPDAIQIAGRSMSGEALLRCASAVAARIQGAERVAIEATTSLQTVVGVVGTLLADATAVVLPRGEPPSAHRQM